MLSDNCLLNPGEKGAETEHVRIESQPPVFSERRLVIIPEHHFEIAFVVDSESHYAVSGRLRVGTESPVCRRQFELGIDYRLLQTRVLCLEHIQFAALVRAHDFSFRRTVYGLGKRDFGNPEEVREITFARSEGHLSVLSLGESQGEAFIVQREQT